MNRIILVGRLAKEPETRSANGKTVCTLTLAVKRSYGNETDFFKVIVWGAAADNCSRCLVKGQQIAVDGELRTREWEGKDGQKRYATEINAERVDFLGKPTESKAKKKSGENIVEDAVEVDDEGLPF